MKKEIENCIDVINYLVETLPQIEEYSFITFQSYNILQERDTNKEELKNVFDNALSIRSKYSFPFWDSFNVSLFNQQLTDFSFLKQIKFHNNVLNINTIRNKFVAKFLEDQKGKEDYLTISSKVKLNNGTVYHLPLLDFHIPVNKENEIMCVEIIKSLELKGFLLNSGKSYHFYGTNIITESTLIDLLAQALLFAPIIDRAWISHQLIERRCCLRISEKYSRLPFKVHCI
jgi:hypothetical protein